VNEVLAPVWSEHIDRLRLGIQPLDALGRPTALDGIGLHLEDVPRPWVRPDGRPKGVGDGIGLPGPRPSPSGRFSLLFDELRHEVAGRVTIRLVDAGRRYVPRRLSVSVPSYQAVVDGDAAHAVDPTAPLLSRVCRPVLFPGAGYGVAAGATVVRGIVRFADGEPARWVRVEATTANPITIVDDNGNAEQLRPMLGHAHGDDRGEFFLVVGPLSREVAATTSGTDFTLSLRIWARPRPASNAAIDSPAESRDDPLWDLPIVRVQGLDSDDAAITGGFEPDPTRPNLSVPQPDTVYTIAITRQITCHRGRPTRPAVTFTLPV
jgi:hypothetical protein